MKLNSRTMIGAVGVIALTLFVLAGSGMALNQGPASSPLAEGDDDSIAQSNVSLSEDEAIAIATAEADGDVQEVELESEDGTPIYEVEIVSSNGTGTEVAVHANDGTVLGTEVEDDENEVEEDDENEVEEDDENEVGEDNENEEEEDDEAGK